MKPNAVYLRRSVILINLQVYQGKKEKRQITNIRNESGDITIDNKIREYSEKYLVINLTIQMKWANAFKDTQYQGSLKKK